MKGVSPFISFSLTFLLSIVIMGILLTTLSPYFEKAKTSAIIDEALNNLYALDKAIKEVASEGIGSQRVIDVKVSGGTYRVDNNTGTLEYTLKTSIAPFEYGITKQYGNIRLYSGGTAKVYLEDNDTVVLENKLLKIGMRAKSYEQNWTGIKWNYGCWKYYNGSNFTNIFDHVVLYLPLEEGSGNKVVDYSGKGNNGTISGARWTMGKYGNGLEFDGIDDCVEVPDSPSLNITNEITIAVWVNVNNFTKFENILNNGLYRFLHRGEYAGDRIYFLYRIVEDDNPGDSSWSHWAGVRTLTELEEGKWYHIVGIKSGNTMSIYLNGIKERELDCLTGYTVDTSYISNLKIGTDPFNGTIDEVMIFNKALNDTEIKWLYEHTRWKYQTDFLQVSFDENFVNVSDYTGKTLETIYLPGIKIDGKPLADYFTIENLSIYYYDWTRNGWMGFGCNNITFEHLPELGYDWPDVDNTTGYFIDPRFKQEIVLLYSWINGDKALNMTFLVTAHDPILRMKIDKSW